MVLFLVHAAADLVPILTVDDSRVVTTRDKVGMQLIGYIKQSLPLDVFVAEHARIWRSSSGYRLPERLDDLASEGVFHVDIVPGNSKILALGLRPSRGADVTAGTVLREVQGDPDDMFTKFFQEQCRYSRVYPSAHSDHDAHERNPATRQAPGIATATVILVALRNPLTFEPCPLLGGSFLGFLLDVKSRRVGVFIGFVSEAAHQLATDARYLVGIQAQVLHPGALETDRFDLLEETVAA